MENWLFSNDNRLYVFSEKRTQDWFEGKGNKVQCTCMVFTEDLCTLHVVLNNKRLFLHQIISVIFVMHKVYPVLSN